jgi:hypothetical protein
MLSKIPPGEGEPDFGQALGPSPIDQQIRQAIHMCWMMLPESKRTVDEVEKHIRRIVERALKDLREDGEAFKKP